MTGRLNSRRAGTLVGRSTNAAANSLPSVPRPLIALACALGCAGASAQGYPEKPIRIIVSTAPGGPVDLVGRLAAQKLGEFYGRNVLVENRPGGGGSIGATTVAKAAPDGYTLLVASPATLCVSPAIHSNLPYNTLRDFAPISLVTVAPFMLVVHPSLPVRSVKDLIALARAKPGELNYASASPGTFTHVAMELFNSMAKVKIVNVPYAGANPAALDVMSGRMQMMLNSVATTVPFLKTGKLRGVAMSSAKRSALLPELPTIAESGLPGYEATNWYGLATTAGTPREVVASLLNALEKSMNTPDMKTKMLTQGLEPEFNTPDKFTQILKDELVKWAKVVKESGATVE